MKKSSLPTSGPSSSDHSSGIVEAATRNDLKTVLRVLNVNPSAVNEQNEIGVTALMASSGRGHRRIIEVIVTVSHLDWTLRDDQGRTALDYSIGQPEVFDYLVSRAFGDIDLLKPEWT